MNNREEFFNSVCREVRFRAARNYVKAELSAHIDDKEAELTQSGVEDAEAEAIKAMGDPVQTGQALHAIHRPRIEWGIIVCVIILCIAGIATLLWSQSSQYLFEKELHPLETQFTVVAAGLALMLALMHADYTLVTCLRHLFCSLGVLAVAAFVLLGGGFTSSLYSMTGDVSAFLLFLGVIGVVAHEQGKGLAGLLKAGLLAALAAFALLLLPSSRHALLFSVAMLGVFFYAALRTHFSHRRGLHIGIITAAVITALALLIVLIPPESWSRRITFGSHINVTDEGYATAVARDVLSGARLIGPSGHYIISPDLILPYGDTDYVLTAIIGNFGWLAGIAAVLLYTAMLVLMFQRTRSIGHAEGRMMCIGIVTLMITGFAVTLITNLGLAGGISGVLPFVSYGIPGNIFNCALVGVFLSVWRRSSFMPRDAVLVFSAASPTKDAAPAPPIQ